MSTREYHTIDVTDHDLHRLTRETLAALYASNTPPKLFRYGNRNVRLARDDHGYPILLELNEARMQHRLAEIANWRRLGSRGETYSAFPPVAVVQNVLATPNLKLPVLEQIAELPIFAPDGILLSRPKYHEGGRLVCAPPEGFTLRPVSSNPGRAEIEEAAQLVLRDFLEDFPFVTDADKAHAIAAFLLLFARPLINGPTPLHLIDKPAPGTGATLLAQLMIYIALGGEVSIMTEARDEEEWRRRLLAKLLSGARALFIDNISKPLASPALSAAITAQVFEDRLIRTSEMVRVPINVLWIATGNNPVLSNDIARRTVRIHLDAHADKPWLRTGFLHPDLMKWVRENHMSLVWAALTMIQAWITAGRPISLKVLGMFEQWSQVMGGILEVDGINGFLSGLEAMYEDTDEETGYWTGFTSNWWATHGDKVVSTAELIGLTVELILDEASENSSKIKLGKELRRMRDRQFNGLRIVQAGIRRGSQLWKLEQVGSH